MSCPVTSERRIRGQLSWLLALWACLSSGPASGAEPPYPPSHIIESVSWDFENALRDALGSDIWPVTWGEDDKVYTAWGDGMGFPGGVVDSKVSYGIAAITGMPPSHRGADVSGFEPRSGKGKVSAVLSAGSVLYMAFLRQDGSHDYAMAYSVDRGVTFTECPTRMWPSSGTFFPSGFVNFGRDNAGARDGYLYLYGSKWTWTQGAADNINLARAPAPPTSNPGEICSIANFEYLSGPDMDLDGVFDGGTPSWSSEVSDKVAVFSDPNGVANTGMATVVYNRPLRRYILAVSHRPAGEPIMAGVGQLGVFEGLEPWGPWRTVAYEDNWGGYGTGESLGYHIATKWISTDGRTFWMAFSSTGSLDSFNLIKGTFILPGEENQPRATRPSSP